MLPISARVSSASPAWPRSLHLPEVDVLRGGAILLVLYLHSYFTAWPEVTETSRRWLAISHYFAHGAVPCFLFISGFLLGRDHSQSFGAFAAGRLRRVAVPGLTWMTLALGYEAWRGGGVSSDLLRRFVLFDIEGQFYFLFVLGTLMAAAYRLRHAPSRFVGLVTLVAFIVGLVTIGWYERQEMGGDLAVVAYRNPLIWAFFFLFGLYAQRLRDDLTWGKRVECAAAAGMAVAFSIYLWQGRDGTYPTSYFGVTVFMGSALGLVVYPSVIRWALQWRPGRMAARPFVALAPFAFAIFLVHKPYFLGWLSAEVLMGTRFEESWGRLMLANFVVGAAGSIVFVVLVGVVSRRIASTLVGVDRPRPRRVRRSEEERRAA